MPYENISDLPKEMENMPMGARKIFLAAFNSAFNQYKDEKKAFATAWAAVEKKFKKEGEMWVAKADSEINDFDLFCDIKKVDEEKRMVFGYATNDTLDSQGEIIENEATRMAIEDYSKWRNLRVMHKAEPVGTVPVIEMRTDGLWIGAEVVDDDAWNKVKKGVYKGFSVGGKKLKAVSAFDEKLKKGITRIKEYLLNEISLVDRPANPSAIISFIKRDSENPGVDVMSDTAKVEPAVVAEAQPLAKEVSEPAKVEAPATIEKAVVPEVKVEVKPEIAKEVQAKEPEIAKAEPKPIVEETITLSKAEFDALKKNADLAKKQDELLDLVKAEVLKKFASEEPKELVAKEEKKVPKTIGEISVLPGGLFSKK